MSTEASEVGAEPSLASILSDSEPSTPEPAAETPQAAETSEAPAAETAEAPAQPRAADGKFAAKQQPETPAAQPEASKEQPAAPRPDWVNALIAERKQKQAAQRALQTQPQQPKPDFFENPERAIEEKVTERSAALEGRLFSLSLKAARASHPDYDVAGRAFTEAAKENPRLLEALQNDEDPGELIYAIGMQIHELADVGGDLLKYREKVTSQTRAELTAKDTRIKALETEMEALKKQLADLSTVGRSLNAGASVRAASVAETDEEDIRTLTRFGKKTA